MPNINYPMPDDVMKGLRKQALDEERPQREIVEDALRLYLGEERDDVDPPGYRRIEGIHEDEDGETDSE